MMNNFRKRLLTELAITLSLVGIIAAVIFFISSDIRSLSADINSKSLAFSSGLRASSELVTLREEAKAAAPAKEKMAQVIIDRPGLLSFQGEIRAAAIENELNSTFRWGQETEFQEGFRTISFQMSLQGPYGGITNFLRDIESEFRLLSVHSINILASGDQHSASLDASIVFRN